ncbi:hypothetical protein T492DRAFT_199371 [Pavlovales sp. CCMP2436]|nr:hypothetical protein T492DRAFT_199371 [Pavlovales sp. CCMP2436]
MKTIRITLLLLLLLIIICQAHLLCRARAARCGRRECAARAPRQPAAIVVRLASARCVARPHEPARAAGGNRAGAAAGAAAAGSAAAAAGAAAAAAGAAAPGHSGEVARCGADGGAGAGRAEGAAPVRAGPSASAAPDRQRAHGLGRRVGLARQERPLRARRQAQLHPLLPAVELDAAHARLRRGRRRACHRSADARQPAAAPAHGHRALLGQAHALEAAAAHAHAGCAAKPGAAGQEAPARGVRGRSGGLAAAATAAAEHQSDGSARGAQPSERAGAGAASRRGAARQRRESAGGPSHALDPAECQPELTGLSTAHRQLRHGGRAVEV